MIKISTIAKLSAATLLSTCVSMANAGERVSDFSLVDAKGRFFQLSRHANQDAVVVLAQDGSRDIRKAAKDIASLAAQFEGQRVEFVMLDSTGNADKAALLKAAEKAGIELRILVDDTQLVAEELGLTCVRGRYSGPQSERARLPWCAQRSFCRRQESTTRK